MHWARQHHPKVGSDARSALNRFNEEYARALVKPLGSVQVRFVSIPALIRMKEIAGRPQDKVDIEYLRRLAGATK